MRNLLLLALVCVLYSVSAQAQSNYRPGYVIKSKGDTLEGYINYREWANSPKSVEFKQNLNDEKAVMYASTDIQGFNVSGKDAYVSYVGPVSLSTSQLADLKDYIDTATRFDNVFLNVVSSGDNVVLFQHEDNIKQRFFISEKGAAPIELIFNQYNRNGKVVAHAPFRQELIRLYKLYVPNSEGKTPELLEARYNRTTLIKYINAINNNSNVYSKYVIEKAKLKIHFFAGAGAAFTSATFSGPVDFGFPQPASFTTTTPMISAGVDIFRNDEIRKLFFNIGVSYYTYSKTIQGNIAEYSFKKGMLTISPQVVLNVYNKKMFKFFIGGGVQYNISTTPLNQMTITKSGYAVSSTQTDVNQSANAYPAGTVFDYNKAFKINEKFLALQFQTGVILNQHIQIYLSASPTKWQFTIKPDVLTVSRNTMFAGMNYIF
jgi:hypothetical protein